MPSPYSLIPITWNSYVVPALRLWIWIFLAFGGLTGNSIQFGIRESFSLYLKNILSSSIHLLQNDYFLLCFYSQSTFLSTENKTFYFQNWRYLFSKVIKMWCFTVKFAFKGSEILVSFNYFFDFHFWIFLWIDSSYWHKTQFLHFIDIYISWPFTTE